MIIGHIGVRKGSKGVPRKNFRDFCGKPLIDWSLDLLLASDRVDCVVVSTDDEEIYEHAVAKGTLPMGLRPDHLATDTAAKWPVWQHALEAVENLTGEQATTFLDLDCTAPMRVPDDIPNALDLFEREKPDMIISCTHARKNPYFNMLEQAADGSLHVSKPLPDGVVARQQAPDVLEHTGVAYVVDPAYLKRARSLMEGRVIPYIIPSIRGTDIDSETDFRIAELLMKARLAGETFE